MDLALALSTFLCSPFFLFFSLAFQIAKRGKKKVSIKFRKFLQSSSSLPHVQYYSLSGLLKRSWPTVQCHHSREKLETKHGYFFFGLITHFPQYIFWIFFTFFTFHYSLPTPTLMDTPFKKLSKLREKQEKQFFYRVPQNAQNVCRLLSDFCVVFQTDSSCFFSFLMQR